MPQPRARHDPYPLGRDDYVYRGSDGRYYCRRRDGTIGLVAGAAVGGVLGNLIAPRGSKTLWSLIVETELPPPIT